ncbi:GAF domain-containing protein [Burkholderiaceae bacterium DAT-1]|nr:GAF domain-containing protein [Burkholderiaceae bacterium DAT-1]
MDRRLKRLEAVQEMVLSIDLLQSSCDDLTVFLAAVHAELSRIIYAENFYVALYDADRHGFQIVYMCDSEDEISDPDHLEVVSDQYQSLTAWVVLNRKPLILTAAQEEEISKTLPSGRFTNGKVAEHWMGMPLLRRNGSCLGAIVTQSYDPARTFSEEDQALFRFIANHIATVVDQLQTVKWLEQSISDRTALLEAEVADRKRGEQLQHALYEIAALSAEGGDVVGHYKRLHEIFGRVMYAPNFVVALYDESCQEISIAYIVDEKEDSASPDAPVVRKFPMGEGMTSLVIRSRQPWLIDGALCDELQATGRIGKLYGSRDFYSWMGVPLIVEEHLYGVLIVQSYDPDVLYNQSDLEVLNFIGNHVAAALARWTADHELKEAQAGLTRRNAELSDALESLKVAQAELVRQEKLASLGGLVAGIAHEVNTPLGICVTATSHLSEELKLVEADLNNDQLDEDGLRNFFKTAGEAVRILQANTQRAAALVRSFKQVAVDQSSDVARDFNLGAYLDEIILSLRPNLKNSSHAVNLDCPPDIEMFSFPGALSQVVSNLVMNSLIHGFDGVTGGKIDLSARREGDVVRLIYQDTGKGMDEASLQKLFDPFFTTKRGQGGSGLGAHIVFNLITGVLGGKVSVSSKSGEGLRYECLLPVRQAGKAAA